MFTFRGYVLFPDSGSLVIFWPLSHLILIWTLLHVTLVTMKPDFSPYPFQQEYYVTRLSNSRFYSSPLFSRFYTRYYLLVLVFWVLYSISVQCNFNSYLVIIIVLVNVAYVFFFFFKEKHFAIVKSTYPDCYLPNSFSCTLRIGVSGAGIADRKHSLT